MVAASAQDVQAYGLSSEVIVCARHIAQINFFTFGTSIADARRSGIGNVEIRPAHGAVSSGPIHHYRGSNRFARLIVWRHSARQEISYRESQLGDCRGRGT